MVQTFPPRPRESFGAAVLLFVAVVAGGVCARRLVGALPLSMPVGAAILGTVAIGGLMFAGLRLIFTARVLPRPAHLACGFAGLAAAVGLTAEPLPLLICLLVTGATTAALGWVATYVREAANDQETVRYTPAEPVATDSPAELNAEAESDFETAWLRLARVRRDGFDVLEGTLTVEFAAGESAKTVHLPVWPPFAGEPEVECECDDDTVRVRPLAAKSHGLSLEVRRGGSAKKPSAAEVAFAAMAPLTEAAGEEPAGDEITPLRSAG